MAKMEQVVPVRRFQHLLQSCLATLFLVNTCDIASENVCLHIKSSFEEREEKLVAAPHFPKGWMCGKALCSVPFEFVVMAGIGIDDDYSCIVTDVGGVSFLVTEPCRIVSISRISKTKDAYRYVGEMEFPNALLEEIAAAWGGNPNHAHDLEANAQAARQLSPTSSVKNKKQSLVCAMSDSKTRNGNNVRSWDVHDQEPVEADSQSPGKRKGLAKMRGLPKLEETSEEFSLNRFRDEFDNDGSQSSTASTINAIIPPITKGELCTSEGRPGQKNNDCDVSAISAYTSESELSPSPRSHELESCTEERNKGLSPVVPPLESTELVEWAALDKEMLALQEKVARNESFLRASLSGSQPIRQEKVTEIDFPLRDQRTSRSPELSMHNATDQDSVSSCSYIILAVEARDDRMIGNTVERDTAVTTSLPRESLVTCLLSPGCEGMSARALQAITREVQGQGFEDEWTVKLYSGQGSSGQTEDSGSFAGKASQSMKTLQWADRNSADELSTREIGLGLLQAAPGTCSPRLEQSNKEACTIDSQCGTDVAPRQGQPSRGTEESRASHNKKDPSLSYDERASPESISTLSASRPASHGHKALLETKESATTQSNTSSTAMLGRQPSSWRKGDWSNDYSQAEADRVQLAMAQETRTYVFAVPPALTGQSSLADVRHYPTDMSSALLSASVSDVTDCLSPPAQFYPNNSLQEEKCTVQFSDFADDEATDMASESSSSIEGLVIHAQGGAGAPNEKKMSRGNRKKSQIDGRKSAENGNSAIGAHGDFKGKQNAFQDHAYIRHEMETGVPCLPRPALGSSERMCTCTCSLYDKNLPINKRDCKKLSDPAKASHWLTISNESQDVAMQRENGTAPAAHTDADLDTGCPWHLHRDKAANGSCKPISTTNGAMHNNHEKGRKPSTPSSQASPEHQPTTLPAMLLYSYSLRWHSQARQATLKRGAARREEGKVRNAICTEHNTHTGAEGAACEHCHEMHTYLSEFLSSLVESRINPNVVLV